MAIIIQNKTAASVVRKSTENRNQLPHKGDIYIGTGNKIEDGSTIPDTKGQNIIDAINENATGKDISAGSFTAASFKGNADSATRATYASADTTKGTIEERLTKLGFKELLINRQFVPVVSGANLPGTLIIKGKGTSETSDTTREGNRTNLLFSLSLSTSSQPYGSPMFNFFTGTEATCPAGFVPEEYRPASMLSGTFGFYVVYRYDNGISFKSYIAVGCTVHIDGSVTLKAFSPTLSGVSQSPSLASVTVDSMAMPAILNMGYQSKPL